MAEAKIIELTDRQERIITHTMVTVGESVRVSYDYIYRGNVVNYTYKIGAQAVRDFKGCQACYAIIAAVTATNVILKDKTTGARHYVKHARFATLNADLSWFLTY
jgi:hypothetical protein